MPKQLYKLWPELEARLPEVKYERLKEFYQVCTSQPPGRQVTPASLGRPSWHDIIRSLAYYEEHGRPFLPTRDHELIEAYRAFHVLP